MIYIYYNLCFFAVSHKKENIIMTSKLHKFLITLFLSLLILPVFTICTFAETRPSVFSVSYASQRGTLSGYGSGSISGSNTHDGELWIDVTGT